MDTLLMQEFIDWLDAEWENTETFTNDLYTKIRSKAEELKQLEQARVNNSESSFIVSETKSQTDLMFNSRHK